MKRPLFYAKEMADLTEMQAIGDLADSNLKELVTRLLFTGFKVFSGFTVTQTTTPGNSINISASLGLDNGAVVNIDAVQTVNVLGGTGGWGTPLAAHATLPRIDIICVKYAARNTDTASKTFVNDTDPQNWTEYQSPVATRIADYFDITVVHGTAGASPAAPATPAGYTKIADIAVAAAATTIVTANITNNAPAATKTLEDLLAEYATHTHDTRYFTETESDNRYSQGAFKNVKVGATTITGTKEDTVELVQGSNVTLSADAGTKKVTINASGITDHGALGGLGDDDHTQYLNDTRHTAIKGNPHSTTHAQLASIGTVNVADTNATLDKHLSNALAKGWEDHKGTTAANPHGTTHAQLASIATVDPASVDTTRDKHVSNKDIKDLVDAAATIVTDHGALDGLGDDDHTQYLNTLRHGQISGNPHSTTHAQLASIGTLDPASVDTTRDKHVANNDIKVLIANDAKTADVLSTDAVLDKHVSNALTKGWQDHKNITTGNPHGTTHAQLASIGTVNPADVNTTRDKHVSNNDLKTINDAVALKAPLISPALSGVPTAPTAAVATSTTQVATTEFVKNQGYLQKIGGTVSGVMILDHGDQALELKAGPTSDLVYMGFYADSQAQTTRSGYVGFGSVGTTTLTISNDMVNGNINVELNGAGVFTVGSNAVIRDSGTLARKIWGGTTDPGVSAADGDLWIKA